MSSRALTPEARGITKALGLMPHPEGVFYRETFRVAPGFTFAGFELAPEGFDPPVA